MITHFYTTKNHSREWPRRAESVKLLCSGQTIPYDKRGHAGGDHAVTIPHNVTCGACLSKLIPIAEERLKTMKRNLDFYAMTGHPEETPNARRDEREEGRGGQGSVKDGDVGTLGGPYSGSNPAGSPV